VTSKTDTTVSTLTAGNCVDRTKTAKPSIATLQYRDGRYEVPKDMRYSD
jgi:hypothetical protein